MKVRGVSGPGHFTREEKSQIFCLCQESNLRSSSPVTMPADLSRSPLFPLITIHTAENTQLSISICEQAAYFSVYFPGRIRDWLHDGLDDLKFDSSRDKRLSCVKSGFRREVDENCAILGYCAAGSGNSLPTFQDNLSAPSSNAKNPRRPQDSWPLKMGPINCPETSLRNCHYSLRNSPEQRSSQEILFSETSRSSHKIPPSSSCSKGTDGLSHG